MNNVFQFLGYLFTILIGGGLLCGFWHFLSAGARAEEECEQLCRRIAALERHMSNEAGED